MPSIGDNRQQCQQTEPQTSGTFWKKVGVGAFYVATAPVTIAVSVIWTGCAVAHGLVKPGHFKETVKHDMKVLQTGLARPLKWLKKAPKEVVQVNRVAQDAIHKKPRPIQSQKTLPSTSVTPQSTPLRGESASLQKRDDEEQSLLQKPPRPPSSFVTTQATLLMSESASLQKRDDEEQSLLQTPPRPPSGYVEAKSPVQRKPAASFEEGVANMLKELDLNSVNEKLGKNARGMKPLLAELKNYPPVADQAAALELAGKLEQLAVLLDNRAVIPTLPTKWMHDKSKEIRQLVSALRRFGKEQAQAKPSGPQETDVSQHTESVQHKSQQDEKKAEMRNLMIETLLQMTERKRSELDKMDDKALLSAANDYIQSIETDHSTVTRQACQLLQECIDELSK